MKHKPKVMRLICVKCSNADSTVRHSNWHYCINPDDTKEFTILRHRSDFDGSEMKNVGPKWCPYK